MTTATLTLPHVDRLAAIAQAYADAPLYDPAAVAAWQELARDSRYRATAVRAELQVIETDDPEPYPDAPTMCEDIAAGRFVVSRANSEHPLWTVDENVAFRIVHDVLGHYPTGGDFGWVGENLACGAHRRLLPPLAARALFTECIAQTAFVNAFGYFGEQKVVLL